MENVPGLAAMYGGKTVQRIYEEVSSLKPIKYSMHGPIQINAADFGVPQLQERILFIGFREDMPPIKNITPSFTERYITVKEAIGDLAFLRTWETTGSYEINYPPTCKYQEESRLGRLFLKLGIERTDNELKNHEASQANKKFFFAWRWRRKKRNTESSITSALYTSIYRTSYRKNG